MYRYVRLSNQDISQSHYMQCSETNPLCPLEIRTQLLVEDGTSTGILSYWASINMDAVKPQEENLLSCHKVAYASKDIPQFLFHDFHACLL